MTAPQTFPQRVDELERMTDGDSRTVREIIAALREYEKTLRKVLEQYYSSGVSDPQYKELVYTEAHATLARYPLPEERK